MNYLEHSGKKGMTWKKHKYLTKKNGAYTYNQDGDDESNVHIEGSGIYTDEERSARDERAKQWAEHFLEDSEVLYLVLLWPFLITKTNV